MNPIHTQQFEEICSYDGPDQVRHFMEHLKERGKIQTGVLRIHSGFGVFDQKMEGIETGEVVVVSGKRKSGKTLFVESWINSMMTRDENARALFLSYEVQTSKLLLKYNNRPELPIFVPDRLETVDFEWLKRRCLEAKIKHSCNIVMIDHLHFLVDMNTKQNMSLNIGGFMRRLKQEISIGMNLAVILIAHQGQGKREEEASMDSIRDSSFIAQEADSVVVVSRMKNPDDWIKFKESVARRLGDDGAAKIMDGLRERIDADPDNQYASNLCTVSIACSRRTGVYEYKKTFQKNGEFLTEI